MIFQENTNNNVFFSTGEGLKQTLSPIIGNRGTFLGLFMQKEREGIGAEAFISELIIFHLDKYIMFIYMTNDLRRFALI